MNFFKSFSYTYLTFTHLHRKLIYKQYLNSINFKFYNSGNLDLPEGPDVSSSTIKRSLKTLGVNFEDGYTCLISTCPICKKKNKSSKVYINKITGFFICDKSRHQGKWKDLEKVINIKKLQNNTKDIAIPKENIITEKVNTNWLKIKEITVPFDSLADDEYKEIAELFGYLNIPKSIFGQLSTRIDEKREHLYFPLYGIDGHEQGYKYIKKETGEESTVPYTNCSGLISYKTVKSKDSNAILVPSIKDLLILANNKVPSTVICLPYGISVLPQFVLPCFEQYNKLTLWFGNDVLSWDTARQFSKKLDEKRCFFIRPSDKHHLPHLLESNQDIKTVLNSAQPVWHKAITTFANLREDVLCDLQNIDKVQGIKWKRFPTLNKILKGHRRGELTIMTGPTGCGKTTFMSEYSLDLAMQGVNTLWGSFEIRNARLARTMLQQMAGLSLEDNLDKFDTWADEFEKLPIYFMTFHGQQSVKIVMEAVEHATYIHDITHVIIDNVQFMMGVSEDYRITDRFWKQDLIVGAFRTFATKRNCHVTLVIHPRKEREDEDLTTSSIFGGAKASQEADNVLLIQDKRLTSVRGKKYLQIAKNRYSGDLGIMAMEFDKESLSYEQKKKKSAEEKEKQKDSGNEVVLISEKN